MAERLLRRPEVETMTGLSRSSIYAMMDKGTFPRPVKLSERAVGWPKNTVSTWIEDRIAASNSAA